MEEPRGRGKFWIFDISKIIPGRYICPNQMTHMQSDQIWTFIEHLGHSTLQVRGVLQHEFLSVSTIFVLKAAVYAIFYKQAVPVLVEGSSQTELKHPKNVYTQYEPRVFTNEEVTSIWDSAEMKKFLGKAENV